MITDFAIYIDIA